MNKDLSMYTDEEILALAQGQPIKQPSAFKSFLKGTETGVGRTLYGVQQGFEQLTGGESPELKQEVLNMEQQYAPYQEANPNWALAGELLGSIGSTLPAAFIPVGGQAFAATKLAKPLKALATGAKRGGIQGGAAGASQYVKEDESRLKNTAISAALGSFLDATFSGGHAAYQAAKPSNMLRGQTSSSKIAENYEAAKGTETSLGRVLENPYLMQLQENVLPSIPMSGANETTKRTADIMQKQGKDILTEVSGGNIHSKNEAGAILQKASIDEINQRTKIASDNYKNVDDLAAKKGIIPTQDNLNKESFDLWYEQSVIPALERNVDSKILTDLEFFSNDKSLSSLKDMNLLRSYLGDSAYQAKRSGDNNASRIYSRLLGALDKDMVDSVSGDKEVLKAFEEAQKYYGDLQKVKHDKDMFKYFMDPRLSLSDTFIDTFVKTKDRPQQLSKITELFDEEQMNVLRSGIFSEAIQPDQSINPKKLSSIYRDIGKDQKKILFEGAEGSEKSLDDFSNLIGMNPKASEMMFNPPTGQKLLPWAGLTTLGTIGFGMGGPAGAAAAIPIGGAVGAGVNKFLTSPRVRESLISKILQNDPMNKELSRLLTGAIPGTSAEAVSHEPLTIEIRKRAE
jgi:hypothetical protein